MKPTSAPLVCSRICPVGWQRGLDARMLEDFALNVNGERTIARDDWVVADASACERLDAQTNASL